MVLVAEFDRNDPRLVASAARGRLGLDAQWADDFHHALHALLTGEAAGYYADYGGVARSVATLSKRLRLRGAPRSRRGRKHGTDRRAPARSFVVCTAEPRSGRQPGAGERITRLAPSTR